MDANAATRSSRPSLQERAKSHKDTAPNNNNDNNKESILVSWVPVSWGETKSFKPVSPGAIAPEAKGMAPQGSDGPEDKTLG